MRLVVTSDLHLDHRGRLTRPELIAEMVERVRGETPDAVVLAGDLAHGIDAFETCVALFKSLPCPRYVLAGNHDVWRDRVRGLSSETLWTHALRAATERQGGIWLEDATATIGPVGLVGSMAWYDYSAMDRNTGVDTAAVGQLKHQLSNDAHWIDWQREDVAFAAELGDGLVARIEALSKTVDRIVVVTHVPLLEAQMHRKPGDHSWGVSNAYFGNMTLGARVVRQPAVCAVVSGHTHWGMQTAMAREHLPTMDVRVVGSDYGLPNYTTLDL